MEEKRLTAKDIVEMINTVGDGKLAYWLSKKFEILTPLETYNIIKFVREHPEKFEEKLHRPSFIYIAFKSMPQHFVIVEYNKFLPNAEIECWKGKDFEFIETPFEVEDFFEYDEYFSKIDCIKKIVEYIFGLKEPYTGILKNRGDLIYIPFTAFDITDFIVGEYENFLFEKEKPSEKEIQSIGRTFRKGGE
jgi:hypothetical protein